MCSVLLALIFIIFEWIDDIIKLKIKKIIRVCLMVFLIFIFHNIFYIIKLIYNSNPRRSLIIIENNIS